LLLVRTVRRSRRYVDGPERTTLDRAGCPDEAQKSLLPTEELSDDDRA
jgi:hypothetical protein